MRKSRERLKEYIESDEIYQDFKKCKLNEATDFEIFCINHCRDIERLLKENEQLKKQIDCIRSGEYYNQLKYERNMLRDIIQNGKVSEEDKKFIDMTHRNTELLFQINEAIEYIQYCKKSKNDIFPIIEEAKMLEILRGSESDE